MRHGPACDTAQRQSLILQQSYCGHYRTYCIPSDPRQIALRARAMQVQRSASISPNLPPVLSCSHLRPSRDAYMNTALPARVQMPDPVPPCPTSQGLNCQCRVSRLVLVQLCLCQDTYRRAHARAFCTQLVEYQEIQHHVPTRTSDDPRHGLGAPRHGYLL